MKPTMYEFLHSYMHNLYEELVEHNYSIGSLSINCSCCPFREACAKAAEDNDGMGCAEFIKSMLIDGADYKA